MFGSDPGKALGKARRLLAEGDALGALRVARKAQGRARPPLSGEIAELAEQARRAVVAGAEERAATSAAEGFVADAAEWLRGALAHAADDAERARIAARLAELEELADAGEPLPARASSGDSAGDRDGEETDGASDPAGDRDGEGSDDADARHSAAASGVGSLFGRAPRLEPPVAAFDADRGEDEGPPTDEALYEVFVDSLRDDVGSRYRDRPAGFRRAVLDLGEQLEPETSQAAIEALAEADPADPVLRLERGRWRLARGDAAGARADLEAAWAAFGDAPLDLGGVLSIPEMWCAAALAAGDHAAVLARLEERGELTLSDPELSLYYAEALLAAGEDAEAASFLTESVAHFPRRTDVAHLLAATLHRVGDAAGAIRVLEGSLRACGPGCSASALHPPSLRLLAALYADAGGPAERLGDVLRLLRGAQGGEFEPGDWRLQARYHELAGEPKAAERARARAAGAPAGVGSPGDGPPPPPAYEAG
jgi:tetratricopeptide (TPR) repeat protein